jgi:hypothetical protein
MKVKDCRGSVEFDQDMIGRIVVEVSFENTDHVQREMAEPSEMAQRRALQLAQEVFTLSDRDDTSGPSIFFWDSS